MESRINYRSPLYIQLREVIRNKIEEGEYPPGTCIPSESQLSETYGLNRLSVRSALSALEYEGLLKSVQGKGVFVTGPKTTLDLEAIGGFRATVLRQKERFSTRVLVKAPRAAGPLYSQLLDVGEEELIWFIRRLGLSGGEPVALEELFIPMAYVPGMEDIDINIFSIFDIYKWNGVRVFEGEQTLRVSHLAPSDARLLGLGEDNAVMSFSGAIRDADGRAIEYYRSYTRSDRSEFMVHFKR